MKLNLKALEALMQAVSLQINMLRNEVDLSDDGVEERAEKIHYLELLLESLQQEYTRCQK